MITDEQLATILADLADHFGNLDDTDDPPFGEYADTEIRDNTLTVFDPDNTSNAIIITVVRA